jgi:hypothetical protein
MQDYFIILSMEIKMKFSGNLTPLFLQNRLAPYLNTLVSLQHTIDEIRGIPSTKVTIKEISSINDDDFLFAEGFLAANQAPNTSTYKEIYQELQLIWEMLSESDEPSNATERSLLAESLSKAATVARLRSRNEHFETRTRKRLIDVLDLESKTIDMLMHLNLPTGVSLEIKESKYKLDEESRVILDKNQKGE